MSTILGKIWNGYFKGEIVEQNTDQVFDYIEAVINYTKPCTIKAKKDPQPNSGRTAAKVSLYWLAMSGIVVTATGTWMPPLGAYLFSGLCTVPFVRPWVKNVSTHITTCSQQYSLSQKVKGAATFIFCTGIQGGANYFINNYAEQHHGNDVPIGVALSNFTVAGTTLATYYMLGGHEEKAKVSPQPTERSPLKAGSNSSTSSNSPKTSAVAEIDNGVAAAIKELKIEIADLSSKIKQIDGFIASQPDLRALCLDIYETDKDNIATAPQLDENAATSEIDMMKKLKDRKTVLEFEYNERNLFFERNPTALQSFHEHAKKFHEASNDVKVADKTVLSVNVSSKAAHDGKESDGPALSVNASTVKIEEVN